MEWTPNLPLSEFSQERGLTMQVEGSFARYVSAFSLSVVDFASSVYCNIFSP